MRVLLISTYELGHQPLHVASPAAALSGRGHEVRARDVAVERLLPADLEWAQAVAISVPMHTAMRLGVRLAERIKEARPELPLCLYGLYAPLGEDLTAARAADYVIGGEYEPALLAWAASLEGGRNPRGSVTEVSRSHFLTPRRDLLPPLDTYARLEVKGERRLAGYVEASHGCAHECAHCPIPVVYGGRMRLVPRPVVLEDIEQLVAAGARHITFGDPDFMNGWRHSLLLVREVHERFPFLTFDCTVKVEHILEREELWEELASLGCLFVVSAVELVDDVILELLDKGHTAVDARRAVDVLRRAGIEMRPSFLPFTPWTAVSDVLEVLDFVVEKDLIGNVDPVQYSIRLLLPQGSLLLDVPEIRPHLGPYDPESLSYAWMPQHPETDDLHKELARLAEAAAAANEHPGQTFLSIYRAVSEACGKSSGPAIEPGSLEGRPRLTEPWFC
ncbi:MAG TPA: CUAEP/CCAEP-tail radical SAM protein [Actinomycetota bacterium]|jgi:radical SAM superfamily enzyme YgiQ (UPF0313 family)|nr:CUAEP/CCAEP-tail radical SAM protein [Actinomycetota bacterium]